MHTPGYSSSLFLVSVAKNDVREKERYGRSGLQRAKRGSAEKKGNVDEKTLFF